MRTSRSRIAGAIADSTLENGISKAYAREVAAYLLAEGRVGELDSLLRDVSAAWVENGYVEVVARTAHPLTDAAKTDIIKRVQALYPAAKKVVVSEVADPDVLGGVRLSVANQELDLSVEAKLNKFKQLTGSNT